MNDRLGQDDEGEEANESNPARGILIAAVVGGLIWIVVVVIVLWR